MAETVSSPTPQATIGRCAEAVRWEVGGRRGQNTGASRVAPPEARQRSELSTD